MKGSRVETIEAARKEYAELLKEGWKKTSISNSYFQQLTNFLFPSLVSTLFILNPMNRAHISAKTIGKKMIASFIIF